MKRFYNIFIALIYLHAFVSITSYAQSTDRDYIRMGNKQFHRGDFDKATTNFTKALEKKKTVEAFYNFGNAVLLQGQDSVAVNSYMAADSLGFTNQHKRARNFHNLGNVWYMQGIQQMRSNGQSAGQAFQNAVNYYKSSLRCNPDDDETRYNLALAQHMLKKNQNGSGGGGNDNKKKDKDKQNQKKKDEQQQQQQQNHQQQQQEKKDQMSDEAAEQLLNSAQQDEKNVQQKVKVNPQRRRALEKDW